MGTEKLGMIGSIFLENGPLDGGIEANFSCTVRGAKGNFRWIFVHYPFIVEEGPSFFCKHLPCGMGTENFGMIGCIFPENGPLESGFQSNSSCTVRGARGDFIRFSYLYPCIFI